MKLNRICISGSGVRSILAWEKIFMKAAKTAAECLTGRQKLLELI